MSNDKKKRLLGAKSMLTFIFLFMSTLIFAQTKTITGRVVDENGEAIIGASVTVKGTSRGTITNLDGGF